MSIRTANPEALLPGDATLARFSALAAELQRTRATLRYVDYAQAERDCERLAARLSQIYSGEELHRFAFLGIPRGGFIVMGMLAYALDLDPTQLQTDLDKTQPLCIVDDCALTGARFGRLLRQTRSPHIVFAHLYSPAELRQAILDREPRVRHCLAAHDLTDHAREYYPNPARYQRWRRQWVERLGPDRYWWGQPDRICFAWSEPDRPFWNPVTERVEHGWRFLPPHLCLKNKVNLDLPPRSLALPGWRVPESVVYGAFDDILWLCNGATEEMYPLTGTAADMWQALAVYGDLESAVTHLLSRYEVDETALRRDLAAFAKELCAKGLLERIDTAAAERRGNSNTS